MWTNHGFSHRRLSMLKALLANKPLLLSIRRLHFSQVKINKLFISLTPSIYIVYCSAGRNHCKTFHAVYSFYKNHLLRKSPFSVSSISLMSVIFLALAQGLSKSDMSGFLFKVVFEYLFSKNSVCHCRTIPKALLLNSTITMGDYRLPPCKVRSYSYGSIRRW